MKSYNMIKTLKKKLKKTEEGVSSVGTFMVVLLTILAVAIIMTIYVEYNNRFTLSYKLDVIMRKYIVVMETEGYLSDENKTALTTALTEIGFTDIDFSGTTLTQVSYGDYVTLSLSAKFTVSSLTFDNLVLDNTGTKTITFDKSLQSTSQALLPEGGN